MCTTPASLHRFRNSSSSPKVWLEYLVRLFPLRLFPVRGDLAGTMESCDE
uniref:Uncharacterized protein n=1 Tax=Arundo donax TaxID=35708 RepID=A0A0A9E1X5_ARUDO